MRVVSSFFYLIFFSCTPLLSQDLLKETKIDSIAVFFDYGSSTIENTSKLTQQLRTIRNKTNGRIVLVGYTDTIASEASNRQLASLRMKSVHHILVKSPLKTWIVDSINRNEQHASNLPDQEYRRVDIIIYQIEPTFSLGLPIDLKINFEPGTDNLLPSATPILMKLNTLLNLDPTLTIQLNGHVCCDSNQPLSEKRAERVKAYLIKNGIEASRIKCTGFSNTQPLVEENSEENQAINRRVEVVFSRKNF